MEGISLKSRAIAFAFCIGAVAFILAMLAGAGGGSDAALLVRGVVVALICGVMSWAAAEQSIAGIAESVDAAIVRVVGAAQGDLISPTPDAVHKALPELSAALDSMFGQVRASLESVHALAMYDPVTGLSNRTNFRREAERRLRAMGDGSLAVLFFIDLDNFKTVNDTLGHAHGDQLLAMVANRLRAISTSEAAGRRAAGDVVVGRLAGDEFTLLFSDIDGEAGASRIARALLAALTEPFELAGHDLEIGASIGIAMRPGDGRTLTALMRAADVAMYHAKAQGRGQFQFYSEELGEALADRGRLENDLRAALGREEFSIALQPQLSLGDGGIVAAEALLRWNHPLDGLRLPESFIGAAEESGLIHDIGNWSVEAVGRLAASWARQGLTHRMTVNLSSRQLARVDFFPRLRETLARHKASPALLELEISETVAMECGEGVIAELAQMRRSGMTITIDDFGAGRSNLARLRELPVDRVKIDESLIALIVEDPAARAIVHALIGLIHGLDCEAIAEGVESDEQIQLLRVMGCDAVQGFGIARPMPEGEYMAWNQAARSALG